MTENNDKKLNLLIHAKKVSETTLNKNGKEMNFVSLNVKQPTVDKDGSKKTVAQQISFITSPKLISEVWFNSGKKQVANAKGEMYTPLYNVKFENGVAVKPKLDKDRSGFVSVFIPKPAEGELVDCTISYRNDVEVELDDDGKVLNSDKLYTESKPAKIPFDKFEQIIKSVSADTKKTMENIIAHNKDIEGVFDTSQYLVDEELNEIVETKKPKTKSI